MLHQTLNSRFNPYAIENCRIWTLLRGLAMLLFVASVQALFIGRSTHSFTPIFDLERLILFALHVVVAALYSTHKWLVRGLVVTFICQVVWGVVVWSLLYPRSAPLDGACSIRDTTTVKWCLLSTACVVDLPCPTVWT
jgi:hypothetical protein